MEKDKKRDEFLEALREVRNRIDFVNRAVHDRRITIEQAASKLRSHSILLGSVACMPFRE